MACPTCSQTMQNCGRIEGHDATFFWCPGCGTILCRNGRTFRAAQGSTGIPGLVSRLHEALGRTSLPASLPIPEQVELLVEQVERLQAELAQAARHDAPDVVHARLLAELDADRNVELAQLADVCLDLAALADDRGEREVAADLRAQAKGWGWLAANRKWPARSRDRWYWQHDRRLTGLAHVLPLPMAPLAYPSPRAALEWVVRRIASGAWKPEDPD